MKRFAKWTARYFLRTKYSSLWWFAGCVWGLSFGHIGYWAFLWLFVSAFPITVLEVWWNDYADDYDDLREGAE